MAGEFGIPAGMKLEWVADIGAGMQSRLNCVLELFAIACPGLIADSRRWLSP